MMFTAVIFTAAASVLAGEAPAHPAHKYLDEEWAKIDENLKPNYFHDRPRTKHVQETHDYADLITKYVVAFEAYDCDNSGALSYEEFLRFYNAYFPEEEDIEGTAQARFEEFDHDQSKRLTFPEFSTIKHGLRLEHEFNQAVFEHSGLDEHVPEEYKPCGRNHAANFYKLRDDPVTVQQSRKIHTMDKISESRILGTEHDIVGEKSGATAIEDMPNVDFVKGADVKKYLHKET